MFERLNLTYSIPWNLFLITLGSFVFAFGAKTVAVHHGLITGGIFGLGLLLTYATDWLSAGWWYFLLNIPLFFLAWKFVSRRFFFYSLYAMAVCSFAYEIVQGDLGIHNQLYAAIAAGLICGAGSGIILRSLGGGGGLDVVGIILLQRYNIGLGKFFFAFNLCLFVASSAVLDIDLIIASLILVFLASSMLEYILALFNQRKSVLIVSDRAQEITGKIMDTLRQGATLLSGKGAYSGQDKQVVLTIINNVQLKRLEQIVFTEDEHALMMVINTFNVLGSTFSKRKLY